MPLPPEEDDSAGYDASGLPRSLRIEAGLARRERGDTVSNEHGLAATGFWETEAHGSVSLDAGLFHTDRRRDATLGSGPWGGTATLWQRNLPINGGWRVDNGLGVFNSPTLPLQAEQYRFFLPSVPMAGAASQWRADGRDLRLHAAYGRAGAYTGTRVVGFDTAEGAVAALGAQWRWAPGWTGAAAYLGTHGRIVPDAFGAPVLQPGDSRAVHLATDWKGLRDSVQLNLLGSDNGRADAVGVWLDGRARRGRYRHQYGLFRLEPDLVWGAYPIQNDATGGYYRLAYEYGRWHWSGGLDALQPVTGRGSDIGYATGYARYQATSRLGYGGGLNVRASPEIAHSAQVFADARGGLGQTRVQLDTAHAADDRSWQVSVDHAFPLQQGSRLSSSVAFGRLAFSGELDGMQRDGSARTLTLALYGGRDLTDRLTVEGSSRWTHGDGDGTTRGLDLNVGATWRLAPRWSLAASLYQSRGSRRSPFVLDPLVTEVPYLALPRERSMLLTVRYAVESGRPQPVVGGAPGAAIGRVHGSVYLDENRNGLRDASERPAPNVTVLLDSRYSVRTDSDGRYEFPRVAVGTHVLTVEPDNLPLPWSFDGDNAGRTVEVGVRDDARIDLGATRPL